MGGKLRLPEVIEEMVASAQIGWPIKIHTMLPESGFSYIPATEFHYKRKHHQLWVDAHLFDKPEATIPYWAIGLLRLALGERYGTIFANSLGMRHSFKVHEDTRNAVGWINDVWVFDLMKELLGNFAEKCLRALHDDPSAILKDIAQNQIPLQQRAYLARDILQITAIMERTFSSSNKGLTRAILKEIDSTMPGISKKANLKKFGQFLLKLERLEPEDPGINNYILYQESVQKIMGLIDSKLKPELELDQEQGGYVWST
jgi:hypothetical protein